MKEKKVFQLEALKSLNHSNVVKVVFDSKVETFSKHGTIAFDETEEGSYWVLSVSEGRDIPLSTSRFAKSDAKAIIRAQLKKWGIKPSKVKWEYGGETDFDDCFAAIAARKQGFYYSDWDKGTDRTDLFIGYEITFDNQTQVYNILRYRACSGDWDPIVDMFIEFLQGSTDFNLTVYEED